MYQWIYMNIILSISWWYSCCGMKSNSIKMKRNRPMKICGECVAVEFSSLYFLAAAEKNGMSPVPYWFYFLSPVHISSDWVHLIICTTRDQGLFFTPKKRFFLRNSMLVFPLPHSLYMFTFYIPFISGRAVKDLYMKIQDFLEEYSPGETER